MGHEGRGRADRPTGAAPQRSVRVRQDDVETRMKRPRSSGSNVLERAALETVKNWRFAPARRAGDPVAAWVIVPVVFRLTSGS